MKYYTTNKLNSLIIVGWYSFEKRKKKIHIMIAESNHVQFKAFVIGNFGKMKLPRKILNKTF